jgi:hypothetical protein
MLAWLGSKRPTAGFLRNSSIQSIASAIVSGGVNRRASVATRKNSATTKDGKTNFSPLLSFGLYRCDRSSVCLVVGKGKLDKDIAIQANHRRWNNSSASST